MSDNRIEVKQNALNVAFIALRTITPLLLLFF